MRSTDGNFPLTTEEELQQTQEQYAAYFEGNSDIILVHDQDGQIIEANPQASRVLGHTKEELLRFNISDFDPGLVIIAKNDFAGFLRSDSFSLQRDLKRKDGSTIAVELNYRRFDKNGETQYICNAKDVT